MELSSAYSIGLFVSILVGSAVSYLAWQNRPKPMATTLSLSMVSAVIWSGGLLLTSVVSRPSTVLGLFGLSMVGMALVVQWCFLVGLEFGGLSAYVTRRTIALLSIQPAVAALAMATNSHHWLFWSGYRTGEPSTLSAVSGPAQIDLGTIIVTNGPGFMFQALYAMVGLLLMTVFILRRLYRSGLYFRKQGLVIFVGLCGPWLAFSLFLLGVTAVDWTPVGVGLLGTTLFIGVFRYGLTEIRPVTGETVVRNLSTGVCIVTDDDRINHCNSRARELLGVDADRQLIGQPLSALIGDHPELVAAAAAAETTEEVQVDVDGKRCTLSLAIVPLADGPPSAGQPSRLFELHDITAQKRQQSALERQNERLERFSEIVSHDLRNPINIATGRVELLRRQYDADEHTEPLDEALARMEAIIDNTLTLSTQGETVVDREPVELSTVATESWAMVETGAATLVCVDDVTLYGDQPRIQRVLENLFRNSIEHGSATSRAQPDDSGEHNATSEPLTVRVGETVDGWYVEDTGAGIPPSQRDSVFETGETTDPDGTGFGLAIVEEIITAHGWEITVTAGVDGGARFEISGGTENRRADPQAADEEPTSRQ